MSDDWPKPLHSVRGPFDTAKIDGALDGMGNYGDATWELGRKHLLQPDLITGMTLLLLARQPRRPRGENADHDSGITNGVSGKVWAREQFTIHRPVDRNDAFTVEGMSTGTHVRKGRRYSTTASTSRTSTGEVFATNLTTGLLSYRSEPDLADSVHGLGPEDTPEPDWDAARSNPHINKIRGHLQGASFGGERVLMSLEMMKARDTDTPDNPIHSDPEAARQAGLARPIAGGSHVLSMALETVMRALGPQSLLYGANFDIRWKAPTEDGVHVIPRAVLVEAGDDRVVLEVHVDIVDGPTAMVGTIVIPLPNSLPAGGMA
jgi:acyl dehydratase